jgi:AcrR family transcriptional regulator
LSVSASKPPAKPARKAAPELSTRETILDCAQKRLARLGADGIRLQDIARDAGVSHPTILHHFGSRDGLIVALVKHIGEVFVSEIIRRIPLGIAPLPNDLSKTGLAFEILCDKGFGGLIGWAFRQRPADIAPVIENLFNMAFESMVSHKTALDGAAPDAAWKKELAYSIRMALMAAAGETLIGKPVPFITGAQDDYRVWMSDVIAGRVEI